MEIGLLSRSLSAVACHGLAAAIETDPGGREVDRLLTTFAADACRTAPRSGAGTWYAGLACTHYGYVQDKLRTELEKCSGRPVRILDPNERLVSLVATELGEAARVVGERRSSGAVSGSELTGAGNTVEVISKVSLDEKKRRAVAARIKPVSGLTARALLHYKHQPDLF